MKKGMVQIAKLALQGCLLFACSPLIAQTNESFEIHWRVEAGFAPFGLFKQVSSHSPPVADSSNETAADKIARDWMPKNGQPFLDWYADISRVGGVLGPNGNSPFAEFIEGGSQFANNPWNEDTGHYRPSYAHPSNVVVRAWLARHDSSVPSGNCVWTIGDTKSAALVPCANEMPLLIQLNGERIAVARDGVPIATSINVKPEHMVVVALGDSYDAGEGNPDSPTRWKKAMLTPGNYDWIKGGSSSKQFWLAGANFWVNQCNRSFFSHETYIALRLAADDPHRLVTYLHYACAGAEIFDGLLVAQYSPPGAKCDARHAATDFPCSVRRSQLAAAVLDLCDERAVNDSETISAVNSETLDLVEPSDKSKKQLDQMETYKRHGKRLDLVECKKGHLQTPTLVLLGIGGNDAKFSSLINWAIIPSETYRCDNDHLLACLTPIWIRNLLWTKLARSSRVVCPADFVGGTKRCEERDQDLFREIPARFDVLGHAVHTLLGQGVPVIADTYPDPIRKVRDIDRTAKCDQADTAPEKELRWCSEEGGLNHDNAWDAGRTLVPGVLGSDKWQFNIVCAEAQVLATSTIPDLNRAVIDGASNHANFIVAENEKDAAVGHGWCERDAGDPQIALESTAGKPGESIVRDPSLWKPYAPMKRYFRTLNDSMRTQASVRDDRQAGTVHPTAEGQAAMAQATYPTVLHALQN